ncbi:antirestriction protein ArdA [Gymnodinialimonas sp.]
MTQLHAQPYDLSATGFYFGSLEEYQNKAAKLRNDYGQPVEEFEIQFIDGEAIDAALADVLGLYQASMGAYLDAVDEWSKDEKLRAIIAIGECGYAFEIGKDDPSELEVDIYHLASMRALAIESVEKGIMGDIPDNLLGYFDYEALARDLSVDYTETIIANECLIYRCG